MTRHPLRVRTRLCPCLAVPLPTPVTPAAQFDKSLLGPGISAPGVNATVRFSHGL